MENKDELKVFAKIMYYATFVAIILCSLVIIVDFIYNLHGVGYILVLLMCSIVLNMYFHQLVGK